MAVPSSIDDLSTTASSNSPAGSESIGTSLDDYLRAIQAIVKQNISIGSNIASTGTMTIPNVGNYFIVTGTSTINSFADTWNGRVTILKFSGVLTLTHSAGLILPDAANITTVAGDVMMVVNESTGVYRCIDYSHTTSHTQTLTNKTIVAVNNTITTAASGDLAATELNAALAELEAEKAPLASASLSSPTLSDATLTGTSVAPTGTTTDKTTQIATQAFVHNVMPAGTVINFAGASAPAGYLECDGSAVNRVTYAALFSAIGTAWDETGGVAAPAGTEFRLPPSSIGGLGLYLRGDGTSTAVGEYQADVFKAHNHAPDNTGSFALTDSVQMDRPGGTGALLTARTSATTADTGDSTETRPRSITTLMCIKY